MAIWDFDDKQANFLDVLELAAESGPQLIKRGARRLYVVSQEDWQRLRREQAELPRGGLPRVDLLPSDRSPSRSPADLSSL